MKVRFETTLEDLVAWNLFHFEQSPTIRWQRILYAISLPAMLFLTGLVGLIVFLDVAWTDPVLFVASVSAAIFVSIPATVAWVLLSPRLLMTMMERNVRKLLNEGDNRNIFGWREMEFADGLLSVKLAHIELRLDMHAIVKIVGNNEYTFVYISATDAYPIPKNLYPEEEYRCFVAALSNAWENRDAPRVVEVRAVEDYHVTENPQNR